MRPSEAIRLVFYVVLLVIFAPVIIIYVAALLDAMRRRDWGLVALLGGSAALAYFLFEKYAKRRIEGWAEWLAKALQRPLSW